MFVAICLHIAEEPASTKKSKIHNYTVEQVYNNTSILNFVRDSLNRPPYKEAVIQIKFAPLDDRIGGLTTQISPNVYFIQLNRKYDLATAQRILFHELVHVHQFKMGHLIELPGDMVFWKGNLFDWRLPWAFRPWEIQAELWSEELFVSELDK